MAILDTTCVRACVRLPRQTYATQVYAHAWLQAIQMVYADATLKMPPARLHFTTNGEH